MRTTSNGKSVNTVLEIAVLCSHNGWVRHGNNFMRSMVTQFERHSVSLVSSSRWMALKIRTYVSKIYQE